MGRIDRKPLYECDLCHNLGLGQNTYQTDRGFSNWTVARQGFGHSLSYQLYDYVDLPIGRDAKGYFCPKCSELLEKAWNTSIDLFFKNFKEVVDAGKPDVVEIKWKVPGNVHLDRV